MKLIMSPFPKTLHILSLLLPLIFFTSSAASGSNFLSCLPLHWDYSSNSSISSVVYMPSNSSYSSILNFAAHNVRFTEPTTPRPLFIVTPIHISHVQATVICARQHGLQIRTRSGGHDYEGVSFVSPVPFILIDMINMGSINIDTKTEVAWVQVGATLGRLYYTISQTSRNLAFPAGISPNVGAGGHISGGGYGILQRMYGLAADNTIDAQIVDVNGRLLDRRSMGEDLFWAIRGGGGASFGVIIAFKVKLVRVPSIMTVCTITKTPDQNALKLVHDWQVITPNLPREISSYLLLSRADPTSRANRTVQAAFSFQFLGRADQLIQIFQNHFPELGVTRQNCEEVSWIQACLIMAGLSSGAPTTSMLNRTIDAGPLRANKYYAKMKSDYVDTPMPEAAFQGIMERLSEDEGRLGTAYFIAHGGRMNEISQSAIPYPHRAGNLYFAAYVVFWENGGAVEAMRHISWNRRLYRFLAPYVSKSPRRAYLNYRDLDVGTNQISGHVSFQQSSTWGFKYFHNNFYRLAQIKAKADPTNFFRDEQSVPPLAL